MAVDITRTKGEYENVLVATSHHEIISQGCPSTFQFVKCIRNSGNISIFQKNSERGME
jgi:hypothetical protein